MGIRLPDASCIPSNYSEHLSFTTGYYLTENDDWLIPTANEKDVVKALQISGFDKALYWKRENEVYDSQEINVMLWQEIDSVNVMEFGYTSSPAAAERRYIVYSLDAVGISKEDAIRIAESLSE